MSKKKVAKFRRGQSFAHLIGKLRTDRDAYSPTWAYPEEEVTEARRRPSLPTVPWLERPLIPPTTREMKGA